jgi:hypothetical protein
MFFLVFRRSKTILAASSWGRQGFARFSHSEKEGATSDGRFREEKEFEHFRLIPLLSDGVATWKSEGNP